MFEIIAIVLGMALVGAGWPLYFGLVCRRNPKRLLLKMRPGCGEFRFIWEPNKDKEIIQL